VEAEQALGRGAAADGTYHYPDATAGNALKSPVL
jgi:hypothetical protein